MPATPTPPPPSPPPAISRPAPTPSSAPAPAATPVRVAQSAPAPSASPAPAASATPAPIPTTAPGTTTGTTVATRSGDGEGDRFRSFAERLPGVRGLPPDLRPLAVITIDLLLLAALYLFLRGLLTRNVARAAESVAAREAAAGNVGRAARLRTLTGLSTSFAQWALGFGFGIAALSVLGVNVAGIIGTASVAGLAFGFGAQKLVKDVITGFFLLLEDQYVVGDYVTINGVSGTVEELSMRTTRIRDDDGKLYILSNGDVAQVCNQSRGPVAGSFEVSVAAAADPQRAEAALNAALAAASEPLGLAQPARVEGVTAADALKTTFRVAYRAGTGQRPTTVALALREAARRALADAQIPLG